MKSSPIAADNDSSLVYIGSHDQYLHALCVKVRQFLLPDSECVHQFHLTRNLVFSDV